MEKYGNMATNSGKEVVIKVENLSKTFRIPHEKTTTLKGAALGLFTKKRYEKFKALDDVSLEIKEGEFFGIIGRNGSGKSTLLKMLAGIYVPDSGKITINGKLSPFLELGVGFNPELTARENVFLGGAILGLRRSEISEKFDDIVRFAELEEFIDMKFKNFSSGMQVRLAFSLAINAHAEILLMDEVLAVGDSNFQAKCLDEFEDYKKRGKTVVLVTHNIDVVKKYCDRALLLRKGKVFDIGRADKISRQYIEQNVGDEIERTNTEATEEVNKEKNTGVEKVDILNQNQKAGTVFESGSAFFILVRYKIKTRVVNPVFGIVIRDASGKQIFVTNTEFKKVDTSKFDKGLVEVKYKIENILAPGHYSISPAIADSSGRILDWEDDLASFRVVNRDYESGGLVDLEHDIIISGGQK
ncbi:MAG: ABC transporter ATP-binding protein [bacterium]